VLASKVGEAEALRLHATELLMLLGTAIVLLVEPLAERETERSAVGEALPLEQSELAHNR
jgi:hypothetical protein